MQGADGGFYGTTTAVASDFGTVFRITPSGAFTNLHSFNGADGKFPAGGLAQGCDGNFYGLTSQGGANGKGTVFKITPAGAFTLLYSFTGAATAIRRLARWLRHGLQFLWRDQAPQVGRVGLLRHGIQDDSEWRADQLAHLW